jgi:ubiquinone biosynthesis protein COQ9
MAPSRALTRLTLLRRAQPQQQQVIRNNTAARPYHSYDHPAPAGDFNVSEQAILSAAYRHVPEHGFTQQALSLGARDAGYLDISTNLLPEGPFSLIRYHLVTQREALAPRRETIFSSGDAGDANATLTTVPARVERLTWERLLGNRDINHRWQEVWALPFFYTYTHTSDTCNVLSASPSV